MATDEKQEEEVFERSFRKYLAALYHKPEDSLEGNVYGYGSGFDSFAGGKFLGVKATQYMFFALEPFYACCQSPIEEKMLSALLLVADSNATEIVLIDPNQRQRRLTLWQGPETLTIEPQAGIGKYRADFLLTYVNHAGVWQLSKSLNKKEQEITLDASLIVECDGHDFHERTKEQASHDRKKDRFLQSTGLPVYRYPGSDIWKDVFACAGEAFEAVAKMWQRKYSEKLEGVKD